MILEIVLSQPIFLQANRNMFNIVAVVQREKIVYQHNIEFRFNQVVAVLHPGQSDLAKPSPDFGQLFLN